MIAQFERLSFLKRYVCVFMVIMMCSCMQIKVDYKHVVIDETSRIEIIERSTESLSSQGNSLKKEKVNLPTLSVLTGDDYVVTIETPLITGAAVFLKARNKMENPLVIQGKYLHDITLGVSGYDYSFQVHAANGAPIEFDVIDENGIVIGHEKITYKVISRGHIWVTDGL